MTGSVLGILCAGLILMFHVTGTTWTGWPQSPQARFVFLLTFGASFGLGSALTGALFSTFEEIRSKR